MGAGRHLIARRWTQRLSLPWSCPRGRNVICARCFHSIKQRHVEQQSQLDGLLSTAERFRRTWSTSEDTVVGNLIKQFSLDQLARAAYPEPSVSETEKPQPERLEPTAAEQKNRLQRIQDEANLDALEVLDEVVPDFDADVFEGENTRGYAGSLPLAPREVVNTKQFIKQGSLVETRGYVAN